MTELNEIPSISHIQRLDKIKTILFDMDGTILDTELLHAEALEQALLALEVVNTGSAQELLNKFCGMSDSEVFQLIGLQNKMKVDDFLELKNQKFIDLLSIRGKILCHKMEGLLSSLKEQGYNLALVTASERAVTEVIVEKEKLDRFFCTILTRNDLPKTKPHPLPYLKAMELLESNSENTLIFEDSETGLMAAKSSGASYFKANWFTNA